jgi:DNA polymerase-4
LVEPASGELAFQYPLPVRRVWGIGQVTADKLRNRGILTVADLAEMDEPALTSMLGRAAGRHLYALARNVDPRSVTVGGRRCSIGSQSALGRSRLSAAELDARLIMLVDRVCRRLRSGRRLCRTVTLRLRLDDYTRVTRSHTLPTSTADTATTLLAFRGLLRANTLLIRERGITLIGVVLANLDPAGAVQLELPFQRGQSRDVDSVLDQVRERYGGSAITRGVLLHRDPGPLVPLLPD